MRPYNQKEYIVLQSNATSWSLSTGPIKFPVIFGNYGAVMQTDGEYITFLKNTRVKASVHLWSYANPQPWVQIIHCNESGTALTRYDTYNSEQSGYKTIEITPCIFEIKKGEKIYVLTNNATSLNNASGNKKGSFFSITEM